MPSSGEAPCSRSRRLVLLFQLENLVGAVHDQLQDIGIDRLLIEVIGAKPDRLDGIVLVAVTGHDDHLGGRRQAQDLLQGREALGHAFGVRRQAQVLEHHRAARAGAVAPARNHGPRRPQPRSPRSTTAAGSAGPCRPRLPAGVGVDQSRCPRFYPVASAGSASGKTDGNTGAPAGLRCDIQRAAAVRDKGARLIGADAHALAALGRVKGPEQAGTDELRRPCRNHRLRS